MGREVGKNMNDLGGLMLLPAKKGTCAMCATDHTSDLGHNFQSIFYQMRFRMTHGRDPTWDDTVAHLDAKTKRLFKKAAVGILKQHKRKWTKTKTPIAEPYEMSEGL